MSGPDIIAVLQSRGMTSTVEIEPYIGQGGAGSLYGDKVTDVPMLVVWKRRKIRNSLGEEIVAEGTVICRLDVNAPEKSRITVGDRVAYVVASIRQDGGGLPTPDHLELGLT